MKINIAVVGLGFGGAFAKIFRQHPDVGIVGVYDTNPALMKEIAVNLNIDKTYTSFEEILKDDEIDAVHLVTPIPLHEEQTVAVLEAGKHCACTVPMAISLEGIRRITQAVKASGKNYMMMETTMYTYQYFYIRNMIDRGELGCIQFMRGSHYQDMRGWPDYWMGLPPMYYGTHAIGPMVGLSGSRIKKVFCFGSGEMEAVLHKQYGNPFPVQSALFEFENGLKGEATRSLFEVAREYQEGLHIYGSKASFEWGFKDKDDPYITVFEDVEMKGRGKRVVSNTVEMPNYADILPEEIRRFTVGDDRFDPLDPVFSLSKGKGWGHHGSHPHMVHEFLRSIAENRKPWIDEILGGNITAAGICAHQSAMAGGAIIAIPVF
ncbi:MAG: Gfo/Idh/MocA family oxidoreductase [Defluviitaleaceae bacterium]|nr:Gfo/Idh/MocA family oxidoreductase [Defluviitaleaceae bacterium]